MKSRTSPFIFVRCFVLFTIAAALVASVHLATAQQTLGSVNGAVSDPSGAVIQGAEVRLRAVATNLTVSANTRADGSFSFADLPIGDYEVKFTKDGFQAAVYTQIPVQGNRTTTINARLKPGAASETVTVEATPLLNQTDTTNGYTLGAAVIADVPLGTGSFTQLAILAPGVSADFLSGSGSNEGLGNQGIVANGQRDTSNQFTFNGVNANNLFNGNSTSNVSDSRFTLNTGEIFGVGGQVQTNSSVFDAIGQALPTPPTETIEEVHVATSMYDASMGSASGAHIETTTKSGTNNYHGQAYEYFQNNAFDAAPTFLASNPFFSGAPPLHRNVFGVTLGGPIKKNKMFFFGSYQGQRISDALSGAFNGVPTLPGLTDAMRSDPNFSSELVNLVNADDQCTSGNGPNCITSADPVAVAILQAKAPNGQYIIPSPNAANPENPQQAFNSFIKGPSSQFNADQANANVDYIFSDKDRIAAKYYFQHDPTSIPFAVSQVVGFPQTMQAGSQLFSLDNTTVFGSNATWENRYGFIREIANATTTQPYGPSKVGLNLLGSPFFPGLVIKNADVGAPATGGQPVAPFSGHELHVGPSSNFANAGIFQNQHEGSSIYHWVHGKHSLSFGGIFDYTQLNIENREDQVATFEFNTISDFVSGTIAGRSGGTFLNGETNRHFRSRSAGFFIQDGWKLKPNLTINGGLRWDWDGPLYETNGLLTNFYASDYKYTGTCDSPSAAANCDSFGNLANGEPGIGLVVAGNNREFGFKNVGDSTLTGRQWMFEPRIGFAWSPTKFNNKVVVRGGFGMYADRGEYFTELSASAGLGISGPFSVTTQEPFTILENASSFCQGAGCLGTGPFGTVLFSPPPTSFNGPNGVASLFHNQAQLSQCSEPVTPTCAPNSFSPPFDFLFGGYDPRNVLPYSENWSLDLQWQPKNDLVLTLGYIGNRGLHQPLPVPFNQPAIATPNHPVNGQIYSYGMQAADSTSPNCTGPGNFPCPLLTEQVQTNIGGFGPADGNTALRAPFIGLNPNADFWTAEGISTYNALQLQATKKLSHGLMVNASYTYSHSLDEGSGLGAGLFFTGNNPSDLRQSYASSDFDRTHVFSISYVYQFPTIKSASGWIDKVVNGWGVQGVTVAQSGEPFSVYDFSGSAGSQYFAGDDFVTNPILPLLPGVSPSQAVNGSLGGGTDNNLPPSAGLGAGVKRPYVNPNDFGIPLLSPGQNGIPPCGPTAGGAAVCDNLENGFAPNGRNIFRSPFETRFDFSVVKNFKITERFAAKFEADAFNIFNHPDFDAPLNDFTFDPCDSPSPCYVNVGHILAAGSPNTQNFGVINQTVGSNRFLQLSLHLSF